MSRYFRYDKATDKVVEVDYTPAVNIPRYPIAAEALAVHPNDIDAARTHDRHNGVPTDYRSDGTPIMRDAGHYKRYRRLHGFHFKNGFDS